MAFESLSGINNNDLITKTWIATKRAYQSSEQFHKEEEEGRVVFIAFKPSFSHKDWFATENKSSFGEKKMNRNQFPCMKSIGIDVDATVNEAFLNNFLLLITSTTSFLDSVEIAFSRKQKIVFTGHSSGGAIAILATVWYLETYFKKPSFLPEPLCVTFGSPLVGDHIFKHALGRENWSRLFFNFVTRFDIVPRIMLAPKASTEKALPHVLSLLDHTRALIQENDQIAAEFFTTVMRGTANVAYKAVCKLIGNGDVFVEFVSGFVELSPYRPLGTFVFSTGTKLVSVTNSDAILQILFYASQSSNEHELSLAPYHSIKDHHSYEKLVQSLAMKSFHHLDLQHFPLNGDFALSDLGLSTRARQCIRAALEVEKQRVDNQNKIQTKHPKIIEKLTWIEEQYKPMCRTHKNGYYDSFKASSEENDFTANVKRVELGAEFDDVRNLVRKSQLPDVFEGRRDWIELATRYRRLMEPLDIANYHRNLKNEDTGPYMGSGRPTRYKYAQLGYEHALLKGGRSAEEVKGSGLGSCFWAEVEELKRIKYEDDEQRVNKLEWLLEGWIKDKEVDEDQIFLEGSTFREWWHSLPDDHKRHSLLRERMV